LTCKSHITTVIRSKNQARDICWYWYIGTTSVSKHWQYWYITVTSVSKHWQYWYNIRLKTLTILVQHPSQNIDSIGTTSFQENRKEIW